jgi:N-acetylglucosaminyldiphosphoundecaprenol N-acetyl-beta-D-mannosaminyltransferase
MTSTGDSTNELANPTGAGDPCCIARVDILGVKVSAINISTALGLITQWVSQGSRYYVCVTGVHGIMESRRDPRLRDIHNGSGLTTPDGMPLVWAGRFAGARHMERVCGPDLMLAVCELAVAQGFSSFFYGGRSGVADLLAERLQHRYPGLKVAGTYAPPFRELSKDEDEQVVQLINGAKPQLVWVGLGTPKQERWMASHVKRLNANILIGVGAAFDLHAGLSSRAPLWMQHSGFEWIYRLAHEPRRLWRRYLYNSAPFIIRLAARPPRLIQAPSATSELPVAGHHPYTQIDSKVSDT